MEKDNYPRHGERLLSDPDIRFDITPFTMDTRGILGGMGPPHMQVEDMNFPHSHTFHVIQYFSKGGGVQMIDFIPYTIRAPMLFFLSGRQVHFWEPSGVVEGVFIAFAEEFLAPASSHPNELLDMTFFDAVAKAPCLGLTPGQSGRLETLVSQMRQEFEAGDAEYASALRAYAERLGVSVSTLNKAVKEATGDTPGALLRNEIVLEAKRLLAGTPLNASEIGFRLNFEDPSYFGRFFRRAAGTSPTAFRRSIRKKYQSYTK